MQVLSFNVFAFNIYIYTIIGKTCQHVVICEHIRLVYFGIASDSGVRYKNKVNIYIYWEDLSACRHGQAHSTGRFRYIFCERGMFQEQGEGDFCFLRFNGLSGKP